MDVTKFQLGDCFSQIPLEFSRLDLVLQVASQVVQNLEPRKTNHRVCFDWVTTICKSCSSLSISINIIDGNGDIHHQLNWSCYHHPMEQRGWLRVWWWHQWGRGWRCCCCGCKEGGRGGADEGSREGGSACHLIILICRSSMFLLHHHKEKKWQGVNLIPFWPFRLTCISISR